MTHSVCPFPILLLSLVVVPFVKSSYNEDEAFTALYYAYAAYAPVSELQSWSCGCCDQSPNFELEHIQNTSDVLAFSGFDSDTNTIVLSFRGTHNWQNWVCVDFETKQMPYPNITGAVVHEGFYNVWNTEKDNYQGFMMPSIETLLNNYSNNNKCTLLITGHSMGAAIAQIASLTIANYISTNLIKCKIILYTFGSPRWSNGTLSNYFNNNPSIDQNWRIVNQRDPIPHVPPQNFENLKYHHTTTEVWYTNYKNLEYTICSLTDGEDPNCSDQLSWYWPNDHLYYLDIYEDSGKCESGNSYQLQNNNDDTKINVTFQSNFDSFSYSLCSNFDGYSDTYVIIDDGNSGRNYS